MTGWYWPPHKLISDTESGPDSDTVPERYQIWDWMQDSLEPDADKTDSRQYWPALMLIKLAWYHYGVKTMNNLT